MIYKSLKECVDDLEKQGHLVRIKGEMDPDLEMAEVQRRVYLNQGPALYFEKVKGSPFPAVSNLFGTIDRSRFIFRSTLERVKQAMRLGADPSSFFKSPMQALSFPITGITALPKKVKNGPVFKRQTTIDKLPQIRAWSKEGGGFIHLPQVLTEDPARPGIMRSNMGMYRIQLSGNNYQLNKEVGLHYQIRRDIGIHHTNARKMGVPLKVSIFVGGPPSHSFAAVMPLPEGMPEVAFAGALGGRRFRYARRNGFIISTEADFCITGTVVEGDTRPEGPFGDHVGYYDLRQELPYLRVESVFHREGAIWPFTIVGRPPQEDTTFGKLVHEMTDPVVPTSLPGVEALHAVDAAGVHPLLLAIGRESYVPGKKTKPMEILTLANSILGFGHTSLAKYLFITSLEPGQKLDINNVSEYLTFVLERIDWQRDLHFQTETTIDSLDYTGTSRNEGSKVVIAACGDKKRELARSLSDRFILPEEFKNPVFAIPGIVMVEGPSFKDETSAAEDMRRLGTKLEHAKIQDGISLIVITEDSDFAVRHLNNFLWITFTRSNPSHDIYGVGSFIKNKHWGCTGPLIIDARQKPFHAPPLMEDPKVTAKIEEMGKKGGCLHGII
ncbi:UbiD family decarboxylase [bacterium]|nr:UbiD family decarboxylase [bacterium]